MRRRLLLNVDDIGLHEGAVDAAVETITDGVAASGSVMAVCPGSAAALDLLAATPDVPVGVHLTLLADFADIPFRPLTSGVSIQDDGRLLGTERRDELLARADAGEATAEFRAQLERVLAAGVRPTHLDWHCLADAGRADLFDVTLALADEYGVLVRAWTPRGRETLRPLAPDAVQDHDFLDSFAVLLEGKRQHLLERLRALPPGLTEWALHPAHPVAYDGGSDVRRTDREFLLAPATRQALADEQIAVVGYAIWGGARDACELCENDPCEPCRGSGRGTWRVRPCPDRDPPEVPRGVPT